MGHLDPVSVQNELAVWQLIEVTVDLALKNFKTTLKEDLDVIEKDSAAR